MSTTPVNSVATDGDLIAEVTLAKIRSMGFSETERDVFRQRALDDFLNELLKRTPPIFESDISTIAELKQGTVYRSIELMARTARGVAGDTFDTLYRDMKGERIREFARSITVSQGLRGPSGGSFRMERR
jgi:hypothetical protein